MITLTMLAAVMVVALVLVYHVRRKNEMIEVLKRDVDARKTNAESWRRAWWDRGRQVESLVADNRNLVAENQYLNSRLDEAVNALHDMTDGEVVGVMEGHALAQGKALLFDKESGALIFPTVNEATGWLGNHQDQLMAKEKDMPRVERVRVLIMNDAPGKARIKKAATKKARRRW